MIMFQRLPYYVFLKNKKYKINVDFRKMIMFEEIMQDKTMPKIDKIKKRFTAVNEYNYYNLICNKELYKEACDKLIWFYKCGREDYKKGRGGAGAPTLQIYSYEYDDEYIFSAFWQEYRIDLTRDKVHWWKFKALLKSLKDDVQFEKIKSYRAYKGEDKNLKELREYYKLPLPKSEQDRLDALYDTLK